MVNATGVVAAAPDVPAPIVKVAVAIGLVVFTAVMTFGPEIAQAWRSRRRFRDRLRALVRA